jgi:hypothetical protein
MTRCDQMTKGELYGCDHCGFEFQVTKESRHREGEVQGACALDMTCCGEPLQLRGHGEGYPISSSSQSAVAQPVHGG